MRRELTPEAITELKVRLAVAQDCRKPQIHLFRGAPAVRSWSKYKKTDKNYALCGATQREDSHATEDHTQVSCPFCTELLHPDACGQAAASCSFCSTQEPVTVFQDTQETRAEERASKSELVLQNLEEGCKETK